MKYYSDYKHVFLKKRIIVNVCCMAGLLFSIFVWYNYHTHTEEVKLMTELVDEFITETEESNDDPIYRQVDIQGLMNRNSQASRWIYVPDTSLDNYVIQESKSGKFEYLSKTIDNKYSYAGSLLVPKTPLDYVDARLMIFGHNITSSFTKNGLGIISKLYNNKTNATANKYIYIYEDGVTTEYEVWAAVSGKSSNSVYDIPVVPYSDEYQLILDDVAKRASYTLGDSPTSSDETLILSTCRGVSGGSSRFYVVAKPTRRYYTHSDILYDYSYEYSKDDVDELHIQTVHELYQNLKGW